MTGRREKQRERDWVDHEVHSTMQPVRDTLHCMRPPRYTHRDVASRQGLVLGMLHPPVLARLHNALAALDGLAHVLHLNGAARRLDLRDGAELAHRHRGDLRHARACE